MANKKRRIADKLNDTVKKGNDASKQSPLVSFSFKYLTDNKSFNFEYFGSDMRNRHDAYEALCKRLQELSDYGIEKLMNMQKKQGCESIPYSDFYDSFKSVLNKVEVVSKDSKLWIFRFSSGNYRIIAKSNVLDGNILYIIGFDFDYSAYDHG